MKINMKILLVCNAGMSTGIMKMKLEQEAKTRGLDASVDAIPMVELGDIIIRAKLPIVNSGIKARNVFCKA